MIIVWTGLGWLVLVTAVVGIFIDNALIRAIPNETWPHLLSGSFAAVMLFALGWLLNRRPRQTNSRDRVEFQNRVSHTLYYIPIEYWSAVAFVAGLLATLKK